MVICCATYGEGTAITDHKTRNSKEVLAVSELIQYLRLPPLAHHTRQAKACLFFASRALTRRLKTPGFHVFFGIQVFFYVFFRVDPADPFCEFITEI